MSNEHEEREGLQMSFLDHLDELRKRLINCVIAIAISVGLCFFFSDKIFNFLAVPVKREMCKTQLAKQAAYGQPNFDSKKDGDIVQYTFAQQTAIEGVPIPLGTTIRCKVVTTDGKKALVLAEPWSVGKATIAAETPLKRLGVDLQVGCGELYLLGIPSLFTLYMTVGLYVGLGLAIPFLLYQIWAFISPGLYKHEKRYVVPVMAMTGSLFLAGAAFAYYLAFPAACNYLLGLGNSGGFQIIPDAERYFDLIIMIMIGLGIVFQIPTLAFLLGRIGLVTPRIMWKAWRHAVVIIAIIAAVLTPTTDAFNMIVFAAPMLGLYFISIAIVWIFGKPRRTDEEVTALATTRSRGQGVG
jgi:sec-independent protein translocase protein TatC